MLLSNMYWPNKLNGGFTRLWLILILDYLYKNNRGYSILVLSVVFESLGKTIHLNTMSFICQIINCSNPKKPTFPTTKNFRQTQWQLILPYCDVYNWSCVKHSWLRCNELHALHNAHILHSSKTEWIDPFIMLYQNQPAMLYTLVYRRKAKQNMQAGSHHLLHQRIRSSKNKSRNQLLSYPQTTTAWCYGEPYVSTKSPCKLSKRWLKIHCITCSRILFQHKCKHNTRRDLNCIFCIQVQFVRLMGFWIEAANNCCLNNVL